MYKWLSILIFFCGFSNAMQEPSAIVGSSFQDESGNIVLRYVETTPAGIIEADYIEGGPLAGNYSAIIHSTDVTDEGTFVRNHEFFGEEAQSIFNDLKSRYRPEKG